jgi:predicted ATPase
MDSTSLLHHIFTVTNHIVPDLGLMHELDEKHANNIFTVTNHIVPVIGLMHERDERNAAAKLCLAAGELAAKLSLFRTALFYFNGGISYLDGRSCWRDEYELALALHSGAGECCYSCGFTDDVWQHMTIILQFSRTYDDTIRIRIMNSIALGGTCKFGEATTASIELLHQLGVRFPKKPTTLRTMIGLTRLLIRLKTRYSGGEAMMHLPIMTDPLKLAAMQVF